MLSGTQQIYGATEDVLNAETLRSVYGLTVDVEQKDGRTYTIFENETKNHKLFF